VKSHILQAHYYWEQIVQPGDTLIDATVGNGHDTLFLSQLLRGKGSVIGYDIQSQALEQTKQRLGSLAENLVKLKLHSHTQFEEQNVKLIVYNLGYLPGGDKTVTTQCETTLQSIQDGMRRIVPQGGISITCYPGHEEGAREEVVLLDFLKGVSQREWKICYHQWIRARSHTDNGLDSSSFAPGATTEKVTILNSILPPSRSLLLGQKNPEYKSLAVCERALNTPRAPSLIWMHSLLHA
jgi:ubiquinone/menaquinone biosynthesis C-methylase UbiE